MSYNLLKVITKMILQPLPYDTIGQYNETSVSDYKLIVRQTIKVYIGRRSYQKPEI